MSSDPHADSAPTDLPRVLAAPPWLDKPKRAKPTVVDGLSTPDEPRAAWLPGEREDWLSGWTPERPPGTDWEAAAALARATDAGDRTWHLLKLAAAAPEDFGRRLLAEAEPGDWNNHDLSRFLAARFGVDALPHLSRHASAGPANAGDLLAPFVSRAIAELMADWLVRLKTSRGHAAAWLLRHGADAAEPLIPIALGPAGKPRRNAEAALWFLAQRGGAEPVLAAAKRHGEAAEAAISSLLATDPLLVFPAKPKALPGWADASALPPLRSRAGVPLSQETIGHVVTMLSISKPDQVYAGFAAVREYCDPIDLADFGWALFAAWRSARFPNTHDWAVVQLRWTGDDHTLRRFAKTLRTWSMRSRVTAGLAAFAERDGHVEALYLDELTRSSREPQVRWQARDRLAALARQRGCEPDQLRDRLFPDPGLDERDRLNLDFGARRFDVGLDAELRPTIVDDSGRRRKSLPKPGVRDDATLAAIAQRRFTGLKQDVEVLLAGQLHRWEQAMCDGRSWSAAAFAECFVGHRLLGPVARRLVWRCHDGESATTFRIAEDGSAATADDVAFTLPPSARVRLPHPVEFDGELARWRELFDDYELRQPFEQLNRRFHRLDAEELAAPVLPRFVDRGLSRGQVNRLLLGPWRVGERNENYVADTILRSVTVGYEIAATIRPGLRTLEHQQPSRQTITELRLTRTDDGDAADLAFGLLPAPVLSELLDELTVE